MKSVFPAATILIVIAAACSPKSSPTKAENMGNTKNKNIDWEGYEPASGIERQNITAAELQGLWSAYEGMFLFGNNISTMKLNIPFIIEIANQQCRRNAKDDFQPFIVKENLLIIQDNDKVDTGIINKLTHTGLIISWKRGANYTRYYYKK